MCCIPILTCCSVAFLMCVAIEPASGQAKQFTLKPSGPRNVATDAIPSSSVMSSVPSPSQKDEGIEYTLVEVEEIPATPTPPLSRENISAAKEGFQSSLSAFDDTTTGPISSVEETTDDSMRPTDANIVLSSPHRYTPTINNSISLEPSGVVSTAPPTSAVVTPPLQPDSSLISGTLTTHPLIPATPSSSATSASHVNSCTSCSHPTPTFSSSNSVPFQLSDHQTSLSSLSSRSPAPSISQSSISPAPSSDITSSADVGCDSPPCSTPHTEADHYTNSQSTVFTQENSSHFFGTTSPKPKDEDDSSSPPAVVDFTESLLSVSTDDSSGSSISEEETSTVPHTDDVITTEGITDNVSNNNISPTEDEPSSAPSNRTSHPHHSEHGLIDFAIKFTASSYQRCANRPTIEDTSDFVVHSLKQLFDLHGSHVFVSHPSCHCLSVNFISVKTPEGRKVENMVRSQNIIFVMNFTGNGEKHQLQLTGSTFVRFDVKNLHGGTDVCTPVFPKKIPWRRLSRAEQIIVITVCTAGAMVVVAAFFFCLYEIHRRHTRKSFRLQSGSANMIRTEDYSLTKLDRPNTMYTDRGMIMEPIQPDDVALPNMYSSTTSLEKQPTNSHLANSPRKEWPLAPDPFPIRPSTSTENLVIAAERSRAGRKVNKLPGFDNPSFSSDDILASDNEDNEFSDHKNMKPTISKDSHIPCPEMNGIKKDTLVHKNLLRPICDSSRSESIT